MLTAYTLSMFGFLCTGIYIVKISSATQRASIDAARTVLIWIFFMLYQGKGHETFDYVQLIGFVV